MREGNKTQGDKCALAVKKYGHKKEAVRKVISDSFFYNKVVILYF